MLVFDPPVGNTKEIEMETAGDTSTAAPPYFAFRTLINTLDQMKDKGIPNRIDRTFLVGMSGTGQTQFIAGLKSLGLIDSTGTVTPVLKELAQAGPADRKRVLGEVLTARYPEAVELGKTNATTGELVEVFREYGATGDTARKGIAFYLQAAAYAGDIPLSPHFQTPKVSSSGGTRRKRQSQQQQPSGQTDEQNDPSDGIRQPTLHPALAGVLSELPPQGHGWTKERRDAFMTTFSAVVNFTIPVVERDDRDDFAEEADGDEE